MFRAIIETILDLVCHLIYRKNPEYQKFQAYLSSIDQYLEQSHEKVAKALNNRLSQDHLQEASNNQKRLLAEKKALELRLKNQQLETEIAELRNQFH